MSRATPPPGGWPIVTVRQAIGDPVRAELREYKPGKRIAKVVYLHSHTGAWISTDRIIDGLPVDGDDAGDGQLDLFGAPS